MPPSDPAPDRPAPEAGGAPTGTERRAFWREIPVLVVVAFVAALLIKTFVLQAFYIPSGSMIPTLTRGDRVLVEKVGYRVGDPDRGDVVVFSRQTGPAPASDQPFWTDIGDAFRGLFGFPTSNTEDLIKRVIGVGGDTVEGRDGKVLVNGRPLDEPYLPDGVQTEFFEPVQVPPDSIFVMGDNRGHSEDSRIFGPVPVDRVVGHAFVIIWPPSDAGTL